MADNTLPPPPEPGDPAGHPTEDHSGDGPPTERASWWRRPVLSVPAWVWIVAGMILVLTIAAISGSEDTDDPASTTPEAATATEPADDADPADEPDVTTESDPTSPTTGSPATTATATTVAPTTTIAATTTTTTTSTTTTTTTTTLPPFEPLVFQGTGSDVIVLDEPFTDAALGRVAHDGSSNFQIVLLDANGGRVTGLVNEIGNYDGVLAVNFGGRDAFSFIEINADGNWTIVFDELLSAPTAETGPGSIYEGAGAEVVLFLADGPTTVQIDCDGCASNFQVTAWGDSRRNLVNEIGAYSGRVLVPGDTVLLEVEARWRRGAPKPAWRISVD